MLGVYGGTFDPIHHGHLRTALEVQEALGLSELRLIPCRVPPHRGEPAATPRQRLDMLRLALDEAASLVIDVRELERDGPSFMVDTLHSIRAEIGDRPLSLIIGMDAFLGLAGWHQWQRLFDLAHVVVMHRPGYDAAPPHPLVAQVEKRMTASVEALRSRPNGLIFKQKVTLLDISATRIRRMIAAGRSARYLLPDPVWNWIQSQGLYR